MTFQTHVVIGGLCGAAAVATANGVGTLTGKPVTPLAAVLLVTFGMIGALLPDIDHPESYIGRRLRLLSWFASHLGHRGPATHSLLALMGFAGIISALTLLLNQGLAAISLVLSAYSPLGQIHLYIPAAVPVGLVIGYASHLGADSMNLPGVPLLYPWSRRRYHTPITINTRSVSEHLLFAGLLIATGAIGYAECLRYLD